MVCRVLKVEDQQGRGNVKRAHWPVLLPPSVKNGGISRIAETGASHHKPDHESEHVEASVAVIPYESLDVDFEFRESRERRRDHVNEGGALRIGR